MSERLSNSLSGITISIVSHGQAGMVRALLADLQRFCTPQDEVIVTLNVDEVLACDELLSVCSLRVVRNTIPLGFGANHNRAFALARGRYFCVLNPDIRLLGNPFPTLLAQVKQGGGVVAPRVVNSHGEMESNARKFPSPWTILNKALGRSAEGSTRNNSCPDWVAGMFMLFSSHVFRDVNGFDERYFLYYEDVDICARLQLAGHSVLWNADVTAQHDGQWTSHSDPYYRKIHLASMARFFCSRPFLTIQGRRLLSI